VAWFQVTPRKDGPGIDIIRPLALGAAVIDKATLVLAKFTGVFPCGSAAATVQSFGMEVFLNPGEAFRLLE